MNTKVQGAMLLLSAIMISSTLTYLLTKAKYEKRSLPKPDIQEEPKNETGSKGENASQQANPQEKIDITKYAEKYKRQNAELIRDYTPDPAEVPVREVIDEDIFDTNRGYDSVTYTLYADGTLVNELNEIVTDPDESVGLDTIERFNEKEHNGAVYIRNHENKMDYEILRDLRSYAEATGGHANGRS